MSAPRKRKWLRIALGLVALYAFATVAGGILLAELALHPPRRHMTADVKESAQRLANNASARLDEVQIRARDGIQLSAWVFEPIPEKFNGDAVLVLHGVSDSRAGVYSLADFLLRNGYLVVAVDARAHGESQGEIATYGVLEARDVSDIVDWLHPRLRQYLSHCAHGGPCPGARRPDVTDPCIFAMGGSMGASIILQSQTLPPLCGIVAEAPFSDFREIAFDRAGGALSCGGWLGRTFFRAPIEAGVLYARLRYDVDLRLASPIEAVKRSKTPILLIHGEADRNNPIRHSRLLQEANPQIELWAVPGLGHDTSASGADGPQYQRRVLGLFARSRTHERTTNGDTPKHASR